MPADSPANRICRPHLQIMGQGDGRGTQHLARAFGLKESDSDMDLPLLGITRSSEATQEVVIEHCRGQRPTPLPALFTIGIYSYRTGGPCFMHSEFRREQHRVELDTPLRKRVFKLLVRE